MSCVKMYHGMLFNSQEELNQYIKNNYQRTSLILKEYPEFTRETIKHVYGLDMMDDAFLNDANILEKFSSFLSTDQELSLESYQSWLSNSSIDLAAENTENQSDAFDIDNLDNDTVAAFNRIIGIVGNNFTFKDASNVANSLIKSGHYLSGYFLNNVIALNSNGFRKGEEYHEAFHAVYRSLLNPAERNVFLELAKKEFSAPTVDNLNSLKNRSNYYNNLSNEELEELYYEEKLADEFAKYAYQNKDTKSWLSDLFDKIIDLMNSLFGNRARLEREFDKILQGAYAQRNPKPNSSTVPAFSTLYKPGNTLTTNKISNVLFSRVETILKRNREVIDINNLNIDDIKNAVRVTKAVFFNHDRFEELLDSFNREYTSDIEMRVESYRDILDNPINYPIILQEMKKRLNRDISLETEDDTIEQEVGSKPGLMAGSSITKGGYMNSPSQIRDFLESLTKYEDFLDLGLGREDIEGDALFGVKINSRLVYDSLLMRVSGLPKSRILPAIIQSGLKYPDIKVFADALLDKVMEEYYTANSDAKPVLAPGQTYKDLYNPTLHNYKTLAPYSSTFEGFISTMHVVNSQPIDILIQQPKGGKKEITAVVRADTDNIEEQIRNNWEAVSKTKRFEKDTTHNVIGEIKDIFQDYAVGTTGATINKNFTRPNESSYYKNDVQTIQNLFEQIGIEIPSELIEYSLIQTYLSKGKYETFDSIDSIIGSSSGDIITAKDLTKEFYSTVPAQTRPITLEDLVQIQKLVKGKSSSLFSLFNEVDGINSEVESTDTGLDFQYRIGNWAKSSSIFDLKYFNTTYKKADGKTAYPIVKSNYLFDMNNFYAALGNTNFQKLVNEDIDSAKELFLNLLEEYDITSDPWVQNELFYSIVNSPRFKSGRFKDYIADMKLYLSNTMKITKFNQDTQESFTKAEKGSDYGDLSGTDKILQEAYLFANAVDKGISTGSKITFLKSLGENAEKSTNYLKRVEFYNYVDNSGKYSAKVFDEFNMILKSELGLIQRLNNQRKAFVNNFVVGESVKAEPTTRMFFGYNNIHYSVDFSNADNEIDESYYYYPTSSTTVTKVTIQTSTDTVKAVEELNRSDVKVLKKFRGDKALFIESMLSHLELLNNDNQTSSIKDSFNEGVKQVLDGERSIDDEFFTKDDWTRILNEKAEYDTNHFIKTNALYVRNNDKGISIVNNLFPSYFNSGEQDYSGTKELKQTTSKFVLSEGRFKNFLINYVISNFNTDAMHDISTVLQVGNAVDKFKRNPSQIADGNGMGSGETKISVVESKTQIYDAVSKNRTGIKINTLIEEDPSVKPDQIDTTDAEVFVTSEWIYKYFLHSLGRKSPEIKNIWTKMFAGNAINQKEFDVLANAGATMLKLKLVSRQVDGYYKMGNAVLDPSEFSNTKGNTVEEVLENQAILNDLAQVYTNLLDKIQYYDNNRSYSVNLDDFPNLSESEYAKENYSLSEVRLLMHSLRVPKLGTETLFNTYGSMIKAGSDWLVFNSATKTMQKDVTPIKNNGNGFLKPFSIKNAFIRQQVEMKSAVQGSTVTDPTQKMEIIGSEQLDTAIAYFATKPVNPKYLATAYAKQLKERVVLGMKEVQNALLHDNGEVNMKNLVKTFKDTISSTNPDPSIEQFFQSLDGEHFDLNPNNYGPTFYKAASMFLAYISKNTTTHKTPGAKFTLRTDWGTVIPKLYKYNTIEFNKDEIKILEELHNNVGENGNYNLPLNDIQQALVDIMFDKYGGTTFEESFTNMISQEKETIYLNESEYYSETPDVYGRPFDESSRLENLEEKYFYDSTVDELVLERLQHRVKDKDGNYYSEVIVSEWVANIFGLKIGDEIPEHLLKFFGVRIPTQDKHSMSSYKIVKFVPAQFGNVLITPYEMIFLAGQDLDIDAVYAKMFANNFSAGENITYGDYLRSDTPVDSAFREQLTYVYYNNKRYKETVNSAKSSNSELREITLDSDIDRVEKQIKTLEKEKNSSIELLNSTFKSLPYSVKSLFFKERAANKVSSRSLSEQMFSDYGLLNEVSEYDILKTFSDNYKKDEVKRLKDIISGKVKGNQKSASDKLIRIKDQVLAKETEILQSLDLIRDLSESIISSVKPEDQTLEMFSLNITNKIRRKAEIISDIESRELYSFLNLPAPKPSGILSVDVIQQKFEEVYSQQILDNKQAFDESRILDITPLNRHEAANIQLQLEIALQHNTGTKEIAGTPATTTIIDDAYDNIVKPSELNSNSTSHSGYQSPADKAIHASNIAEGADGIGIAASFHSTLQKAATNKLTVTDDFVVFGRNEFTFTDINGNRTNDSNSSVISMFVDNPKLALAYKVRMNLITAPIGMTLLGLGIPFKQVVGILNQPSVQRIAEIVTQNSGVLKLKDGKIYAWSKEMASIVLSAAREEGYSGVALPHTPLISVDLSNEDLLSEDNQVGFALLYNAALENRKNWDTKEKFYEGIKNTLERNGKISLINNITIGGRSDFNLNSMDGFLNLLGAYDRFQSGVVANLITTAKINSKMISLSQLNAIKKGVTGSFDNVESIEESLRTIGYNYSIDKLALNKKAEIDDVVSLYKDPSVETPFSNLEVMFDNRTNPVLVENIKSVIYSDRAIASQIFLTRTPFGKRVLTTLFKTMSPYAAMTEESRRKVESSLLAAMMTIRVRKKFSQMKKANIQNIFLDALELQESPLRDDLIFNYEQLFKNNTQVLNSVISYFAANKERYKFMGKIKSREITFKQLGNQTLHKFETQTFTDLAPEDVSQLQDEFRMLMDDPNARPLIEAIIRQSFLVQNGRFKKGSVIKTLDVEVVKEVMSALDDAVSVLAFKPGSKTEFTSDEFINQFGVSMTELIQTIEVGMLSNPDFNFEVRTVNEKTLNIQKKLMEKKETEEKQDDYIIDKEEVLTTDAYEETGESNTEDEGEKYKSVFNIDAPIKMLGDEKTKDENKLVVNLFGGFNGQNFPAIMDVLRSTNLVDIKTKIVPAPTASNPNAVKKVVSLRFPTIVKTKFGKDTILYRLKTVKTDKSSTYKDKEGNKKTKRVVISANIAASIYDVPKWYRTKMKSFENEQIINMWNTRMMKEFTTYKEDGAIMFEGTAAVYEPYHNNGNKEISNFGFTMGQMNTSFIPELNDTQTEQTGKFKPLSKFVENNVKNILSNMIKESSVSTPATVQQIYNEIINPELRHTAFRNLTANEYFNEILKYFKC